MRARTVSVKINRRNVFFSEQFFITVSDFRKFYCVTTSDVCVKNILQQKEGFLQQEEPEREVLTSGILQMIYGQQKLTGDVFVTMIGWSLIKEGYLFDDFLLI